MSSTSYERAVDALASLCPARGLAVSLEARVSSLLMSARIYLSPRTYSRFSLSLLLYPLAGEVAALLFLPFPQSLLVVGGLAVAQSTPFIIPLTLSGARRKAVEAEMPFFLIFLSIFSRDSTPTIDDGLKRAASLGDGVFPAFRGEASILERDLTFVPGSPASVLEDSFGSNPSRRLRDFIHSLTITLTTGKSVVAYLEGESEREVSLLEGRWKSFSESVGSLAEVSLMVLALFPVGLEMVAAAVPGLGSTEILLASLAALGVFAAVLVMLMDSSQPLLHNARPPLLPLVLTIASWTVATLLYLDGVLTIEVSLLLPIVVSAVGSLQTRRTYRAIRRGEEEVSILLHDIAEESKAGVSLPEALTKLTEGSARFTSIREPLAAFHQAIMLGATPEEAQKRVSHPSWLVRLSFGMLSAAFVTGAGFQKLERLSSFFKRLADARKSASRSLLPFFMVGLIVPGISVASMSFLGSFDQGGIPFLPNFNSVSRTYILLSITAVSLMTGVLLSKLYTQTTRHAMAVPLILTAALVSLLFASLF